MDEIIIAFTNSILRLEEILREPKTFANRDSAIKRFELTVELAWKSMQVFLRNQRIICRSPKECLREAFNLGLINNEDDWLKIIDDRNESVHTYSEEFADRLYARLITYLKTFELLRDGLK